MKLLITSRYSGTVLTFLLLSLRPLAAQTGYSWIGGDGSFADPLHWTPEGVPAALDEVLLSSGTATQAGNLSRAALTTLEGPGSLVVSNGRFLNGSGGPALFSMEGGSLTQTGQFFISAHNNEGRFLQSGGAVTSAVTEAWYLSDGAGAKGTYDLSGGTLDVTLSGTSALDRQVHTGKQNNGDLFRISGGTARFTAASANRRFYLSRNSTLQLDSGSLAVDGFHFFLVGRELAANTNTSLLVNDGALAVINTPAGGAFIVGAVNDGIFRLTGGTVTASSAPMWLGDGNGRTGTVIQTGGALSLGTQPLILARAGGGNGHYQLNGGSLAAGDIVPGAGANPRFIFRAGTLTLSGDRTNLVDEPWFTAAGTVHAQYDGAAGTTTLTATPVAGKASTWQFYRFTATRLRDGFTTAVQLAEFEFLRNGTVLDRSGVSVLNPEGTNPAAESPDMLVDGNAATKWLDNNNKPVVFDFGSPVTIDGYRFTTANDIPARDPLRWTLEGSADGQNWVAVDRINADYPTPTGRSVSTVELGLPQTVPAAPPPPVSLIWSGAINAQWNTASLNWTADGPRAWNNGSLLEATFGPAGPRTISLTESITAGSLSFTAAGYNIGGTEILTLAEPARVVVAEPATVQVPLAGTAGWRKEGAGNLTLTGPAALTGTTILAEGQVTFSGDATSSGNGQLYLADAENSRAALQIDSTGILDFSGSVRVGVGSFSAAAVHQSAGTVNAGGPNVVEYLELGGGLAKTGTSYGAWHLGGGTLNTVGGTNPSGIRVGNEGLGVLVQTGGILNSARWVAIGGGNGADGEGVASFLGGETTVAAGYRFLIGDRANSIGTLNLGTLAGGNAMVTSLNTTGLAVGQNGSATRATLNLNPGTLVLGGPIFQTAGGVAATANFNGVTLRAGTAGMVMVDSAFSQVLMYRGGLTVDTAGNNASIPASLFAAPGDGIYPANGGFAVVDGGTGYIGAPLVSVISDGSGTGATAIAEITGGKVSRVLLTCPGRDYQAGETLSFVFNGGGALGSAPVLQHTLTAADLKPNHTGGLVKIGPGRLTLSGTVSFSGDTRVEEGTLEANGTLEGTRVLVAAAAELEGTLNTSSPVMVEGTFSPGSGVGVSLGTGSLTLAAGSTLTLALGDWSGEAGIGYDTASFASLALTATPQNPVNLVLDSSLLTNFTETAKTLVVVATGSAVEGFHPDRWRIATDGFPGTGSWQLAVNSGNTLVLQYAPSGTGYAAWLGGFSGLSDTAPGADPDKDGLVNLMEYVLGGNPEQVSSGELLPVARAAAAAPGAPAGLVFTFVRRTSSTADTIQTFQYGSRPQDWTNVVLPAASSGIVSISPDTPSAGLETVTIAVPAMAATDGRLFGRLSVVRN